MKKIVCSLLIAVLLLSCLAGCSGSSSSAPSAPAGGQSAAPAANEEPIVWKVQGYTAAGTLYDEYGANLANSINAMSNGRLVIDWYAADSIVSVSEGPTAVRDGILDAVFDYSGIWSSVDEAFPCSVLPPVSSPIPSTWLPGCMRAAVRSCGSRPRTTPT